MTAIWYRVQGDVNDTIVAELDGVVDLSGVTAIEAHVWRSTTAVTLAAAVTSAVDRTVTVQLSTSAWLATAASGSWNLEIQATFGSVVKTWPEASPARIVVRPQGA